MGFAASEVANAGAKLSHSGDFSSRLGVARSEQAQGFLHYSRTTPAEVASEALEQALGSGVNVDLHRACHLPIVPKTSRKASTIWAKKGIFDGSDSLSALLIQPFLGL